MRIELRSVFLHELFELRLAQNDEITWCFEQIKESFVVRIDIAPLFGFVDVEVCSYEGYHRSVALLAKDYLYYKEKQEGQFVQAHR